MVVQAAELAVQAAELAVQAAVQVPALLRCKRIESKGVS